MSKESLLLDIPFKHTEDWLKELEAIHAERLNKPNFCCANVASDLAQKICDERDEPRSIYLDTLLTAVAQYADKHGYLAALNNHKP